MLLDVMGIESSTAAVLGVLVFGNLLPIALIVGIYWYMTHRDFPLSMTSAPPSPLRVSRGIDQAA